MPTPQSLDSDLLQRLLALRQSGRGDSGANGSQTWTAPQGSDLAGYQLSFQPGQRYDDTQGLDGRYVADPSQDRTLIYGPQTGSTWSTQRNNVFDDKGNFVDTSSGDGQGLSAAKFIATAVGGYYGAGALNGATAGATGGLSAGAVDSAALGLDGAAAGGAGSGLGLSQVGSGLSTAKSLADAAGNGGGQGLGTDGWGTLARIGGGLLASGVAGNALSNPVDTSRYDALFDGLIKEQGAASQRSADMWADYQNIWRPAQQKLADATMNYDTAGRREQAANQATGQVAGQYDQQRSQAERDMIASGLDPSTIQALGASSRIIQAKDEAGAANGARDNVEKTGLNLLNNAVGIGQNVANSSTQNSQVATGTTQAAAGILNNQAGVQNTNTANRNAMIGDLFGAGLQAYGMYSSSEKKKHMGKKVHGLSAAKAIEKSPSKHWRYRDGEGDGNTKARMGPTAESLQKVAPAVSDGKKVDGIALMGLQHAAIADISKRLSKIEKRAGLSDARRA